MTTIFIINGPNLNLLGTREPTIYGSDSLDDILLGLKKAFPTINFKFFQSNKEGELIDSIHSAKTEKAAGIVLNAGGYTHTSVAMRDAISSVQLPTIEVHLSNVYAREEFRHLSMIAPVCKGVISGFGATSYHLAVLALIS